MRVTVILSVFFCLSISHSSNLMTKLGYSQPHQGVCYKISPYFVEALQVKEDIVVCIKLNFPFVTLKDSLDMKSWTNKFRNFCIELCSGHSHMTRQWQQ